MNQDEQDRKSLNKSIYELQKISKEILKLEILAQRIELDMNNNMNYVTKIFIMRQFEQLTAMLKLKNNENHILISRSMFEGLVYLMCFRACESLLADWRNYSLVIDKMRADKTPSDEIPDEVTRYLKQHKTKIESFMKQDGSFYSKWSKKLSIKEMAKSADLLEFYDKYYSEMSDYHHWGTKSFGIRYKCLEKNVNRLFSAEIKLESFNAWCMAINSILITIDCLAELSQNEKLINKILILKEKIKNVTGITYS